jgi:hypothetical protein
MACQPCERVDLSSFYAFLADGEAVEKGHEMAKVSGMAWPKRKALRNSN